MRHGIVWILVLAMPVLAAAHTASTGFVALSVNDQQVSGSVELAVRDTELAIGLDGNGNGDVTWGELRGSQARLQRFLADRMTISSTGERCPISFGAVQVNMRVDGLYAHLPLEARCPVPVSALAIRYTVMSDVDSSHRSLMTLAANGVTQTAVLGEPDVPLQVVLAAPSRWRTAVQYMRQGVSHILGGADHLLFLLSLLLPAVLLRRRGTWQPVEKARPAWINTIKVVSAFTLAHSITLTLAALDIVHLPSRLTESVIAASIVIAALNNVFPVVTLHRARIALLFGLLHGFGFASVLTEMGLPSGARLVALLSFNVGIEAGQLAVVVLAMPLMFALRRLSFYRRGVLPWGSALIAGLACVWLVQRAWMPTG